MSHPSMTGPQHMFCTCGHYETAHAPRLDEKVAIDGHGACIVQDCDCQRFTFDRFSGYPTSAAKRER